MTTSDTDGRLHEQVLAHLKAAGAADAAREDGRSRLGRVAAPGQGRQRLLPHELERPRRRNAYSIHDYEGIQVWPFLLDAEGPFTEVTSTR